MTERLFTEQPAAPPVDELVRAAVDASDGALLARVESARV